MDLRLFIMQIAGASLFGILLSKYDPVTCLKFAAGLIMWSLPVMVISILLYFVFLVQEIRCCFSFTNMVSQIILTWFTNKISSGVLDRAKCSQSCCRTSNEGPVPDADNIGKAF